MKFGVAVALTVNETVIECERPPPMPVTVIEYEPVAVIEATASVMVEVPEPGAGMGVGLKLTLTPDGWPLAVRATPESKLPEMTVVMDDVPLLPWTTEIELGDAEMVKSLTPDGGARALMRFAPFGLPQPLSKS